MDTFVTTAIVGTGQANEALPETHTAIDTLAAQLPVEQKERSFLLTAGALAIYKQASSLVSSAQTLPEVAAPETMPACLSRNAQLLIGLFQPPYTILLPEALERLRSSGHRIPDEVLPQCLAYGTTNSEHRSQLAPLLGERGRWLSQFKPTWKWASRYLVDEHATILPAEAETLWQEGTLEQRQEILSRLRTQDPAQARTWLEQVWKQEKADVRATLLTCLESGISDADQDFIEQALNDRGESVRLAAARLLLHIPTSPSVQRLLARADSMLDFKKSSLQNKLLITLPKQIDLDWKNDIAIAKLKQDKLSSEYWFHKAIGRISPQHWESRFDVAPATFIDALNPNEMGKALIVDLIKAAYRHHTSNWYQPLLGWYIQHVLSTSLQPIGKAARELFAALAPADAEEILTPLLEDREKSQHPLLLLPAPWSASFSDKYLTMFKTYITTNPNDHYSFWDSTLLFQLAICLDPSKLDFALEIASTELPEDDTHWSRQRRQNQLHSLATLIHIRKRILTEI
ncbi:DUF5691 domain-containing protein [Dictyobacter arantiisoli]|uniref:Uncharacterized protein n=1 Tax=Dictyobacter arantiisoli TaxID=2014874 RepID=A0A5A5TBP3_9CHLR|nr:DUF5691 domain-containing protein [Dictyobacter arantiisoli]GCF08808.1 hypothetical protein KDI_23720 [Dictyobacter arantiisoli]